MGKKLKFFNIVMMTLATVANARNISSSYAFGSSILFYDLLVCVMFFLPASLIVGKFTAEHHAEGGIFSWVSRGLGWRSGAMASWLQWLENVFYYPLSLLFILSSIAEVFSYSLSPWDLFIGTNLIFWALTAINLKGIEHSTRWIELLTILGLFFPLLVLAVAAISASWEVNSHFHAVTMHMPKLEIASMRDPLLITLAGFLGVEINTVHASLVSRASRTIPLAILTGAGLIIACVVGGTWLMLAWLPSTGVHVGNALAHALVSAMDSLGLGWLSVALILLMLLGPLGGITAWIISPVKALHHCLEFIYPAQKKYFSMFSLLIFQAILVSLISLLYFLFDINYLFIMMTDAMVALYMLMYILMFFSALRLMTDREVFISNFLTVVCCFFGLISCCVCFVLCFWKPEFSFLHYSLWATFMFVACILPCFLLLHKPAEHSS